MLWLASARLVLQWTYNVSHIFIHVVVRRRLEAGCQKYHETARPDTGVIFGTDAGSDTFFAMEADSVSAGRWHRRPHPSDGR